MPATITSVCPVTAGVLCYQIFRKFDIFPSVTCGHNYLDTRPHPLLHGCDVSGRTQQALVGAGVGNTMTEEETPLEASQ